jgi:hypothetical protein
MEPNLLNRILKKGERTMTNEYEVATVIELGNAHEVVLGEKVPQQPRDILTGDLDTVYIEATAD